MPSTCCFTVASPVSRVTPNHEVDARRHRPPRHEAPRTTQRPRIRIAGQEVPAARFESGRTPLRRSKWAGSRLSGDTGGHLRALLGRGRRGAASNDIHPGEPQGGLRSVETPGGERPLAIARSDSAQTRATPPARLRANLPNAEVAGRGCGLNARHWSGLGPAHAVRGVRGPRISEGQASSGAPAPINPNTVGVGQRLAGRVRTERVPHRATPGGALISTRLAAGSRYETRHRSGKARRRQPCQIGRLGRFGARADAAL